MNEKCFEYLQIYELRRKKMAQRYFEWIVFTAANINTRIPFIWASYFSLLYLIIFYSFISFIILAISRVSSVVWIELFSIHNDFHSKINSQACVCWDESTLASFSYTHTHSHAHTSSSILKCHALGHHFQHVKFLCEIQQFFLHNFRLSLSLSPK